MLRYHKKVYIPDNDKTRLNDLTIHLNDLKWRYTSHCIDNLKYRVIRLEDVLNFIKGITLQASDIFEYYKDDKNDIIKLCYRVKYTQNIDLIIILSNTKNIITLYINTSDDVHYTLDKTAYVRN